MSYRHQKKYIEELKRRERLLNPKEKDEFKMLLKMDKDEEDFDTISFARLEQLHKKYCRSSHSISLNDIFKSPENNEGK